jgi:aspartate-semialdehyde dehydrogenase
MKMIEETQKILGRPELKVTATTVRVPVRYGHCVSINLEFEKPFTVEAIQELMAQTEGIILVDDPSKELYPMPIDAEGTNEVYMGRIRRDFSQDNGVNMWCVADNIRKGAATNTVQIAELLLDIL